MPRHETQAQPARREERLTQGFTAREAEAVEALGSDIDLTAHEAVGPVRRNPQTLRTQGECALLVEPAE